MPPRRRGTSRGPSGADILPYYGTAMAQLVETGKQSKEASPPGGAPSRASTRDGLRIDRNGVWFHNGLPFRRPALVKLFSTVLKRAPGGGYLLETPVERVEIEVEDAPFVAVEMQVEGEGRQRQVRFRTNIDEWVALGPAHPLRLGERPYLLVRPGIEAAVLRAPWYELAELAEETESGYGVWSGGEFFDLGARDDDA